MLKRVVIVHLPTANSFCWNPPWILVDEMSLRIPRFLSSKCRRKRAAALQIVRKVRAGRK